MNTWFFFKQTNNNDIQQLCLEKFQFVKSRFNVVQVTLHLYIDLLCDAPQYQ